MAVTYLDFELPLAALDTRIETLRRTRDRSAADTRELRRLEAERRKLEGTLYEALSAWQRVELARHVDRPQTLDYVQHLCTDFFELHGDRAFGDDPAIVGGIGTYHRQPVMVIGHQRGHSTQERLSRNFGMASPEGYRKALRLFHMAERLGMPILTFIDTQGAYTGVGAEQRGQAEAIAHTLRAMALLRVPIVSVVIVPPSVVGIVIVSYVAAETRVISKARFVLASPLPKFPLALAVQPVVLDIVVAPLHQPLPVVRIVVSVVAARAVIGIVS